MCREFVSLNPSYSIYLTIHGRPQLINEKLTTETRAGSLAEKITGRPVPLRPLVLKLRLVEVSLRSHSLSTIAAVDQCYRAVSRRERE